MDPLLPKLSSEAKATLRRLNSALPESESRAVTAWLSCFYRYQLEWLLDWNRFALLCKSRQIGASHTYGAAATLWSLLGETTTVVSKGEREAFEVVAKARQHAEVLAQLGSRWARPVPRLSGLVLASGGRVLALPATSGGRSFSGNVLLDEFAYHTDPEKVWDGAAGTVLHGYKLRVISTPNGVGNLFADLWHDPKAHRGYSLHAVTLDEAIADGLRVDLDECWKMARGDPRVFDQLFRCKFLDNDAQYIPSALIDDATRDAVSGGPGDYYAGIDVGKTADLTVLVVVRIDALGVAHVVHVESRKRTAFEDLDGLVNVALNGFRCRRVCIDSTGIGAFPAEQLQRKYGSHSVEAVPFTAKSKEDLATGLFQRFADRKIAIARSETALRDDVAKIRRIVTSAGNIRYDAPHNAGGHADYAWSLALALHGAARPACERHEILDYTEDDAAE